MESVEHTLQEREGERGEGKGDGAGKGRKKGEFRATWFGKAGASRRLVIVLTNFRYKVFAKRITCGVFWLGYGKE